MGFVAEYIAACILTIKGYRIMAMRYKTKVGEVDIVAKRGPSFVFVEVKYRENFKSCAYAVTRKSQLRIRRAAEHYLLVQKKESINFDFDTRFDVVGINKFFWVKHIKNAF